MINPIIRNARVEQRGERSWLVLHPSNDAILAYADSEESAMAYRDAINAFDAALKAPDTRQAKEINVDLLARIVIERVTKDHKIAGYTDERALKAHHAALAAVLSNIAAEVAPHDERIAELFRWRASELGATRGLGGL